MSLALMGALGIALAPISASASTQVDVKHAATVGGSVSSSAAKADGFKSYTSSAGKSVRVQHDAEAAMTAFAASTAKSGRRSTALSGASGTGTSGTTIYATTANATCGGVSAGNGTASDPYCDVQAAVDAAVPGDVIDVEGQAGYGSSEAVTITKSNLKIIGVGNQSWITGSQNTPTLPAITLDGVSNITITNMMVGNRGASDIAIEGSTNITLEDDYLGGGGTTSLRQDAVSIDGASSGITISRSYLDTTGWSADYAAVRVASGAKNVTVVSDLIAASGILATGVTGLDVVGNTIQRGCTSGIDINGASTGVYVENNVLEDADPTTDQQMGGYQSQCTSNSYSWAPDINVAPDSTSSTTADYNDFDVYGSDATNPYGWGGTNYASTSAFKSATGEGAHDTNDTTAFTGRYLRENEGVTIALVPSASSPAVASANASAPGELASDFYGMSPYTTRGAVQYSQYLGLGVSLSVVDSSALGVTATATVTGWTETGLQVEFDWGDAKFSFADTSASGNTVTFSHSYAQLATYPVEVEVNNGAGAYVINNIPNVTLAGSDYTAYGPVRILDTRSGTGGVHTPLTSADPIQLQVAGNGSIPAGVTAVALNVTVTNSTGYGNVAVNPDGVAPSGTSNLNYGAGQTVANMVIVPVGADGDISFTKQGPGSVALIADIAGYFAPYLAAGYTATSPSRILDTRNGTGGVTTPLTAAAPIKLKIAGNGSIPADVTAVAVNLTLTSATGHGNVVAYPDGGSQPTASNVNYSAGQTVANAAIVPVTDGYIDLAKQGPGSVAMIVDVEGYFDDAAGSSAYLPVAPTRLFDSRKARTGKLPAGYSYALPIDQNSNGAVLSGITTLVLNSTVTNVTGTGFLTVFSDNTNGTNGTALVPNASNLNFASGNTVANLTFATPGTNGVVDFYNGALKSSLDLIVDIFGYYQNT